MNFVRDITTALSNYAKFPVIAITGPRQSGKTTLVKNVFSNHKFLSLDNEVTRAFAIDDPEGFLLSHENEYGIILDEFQYAPKLTTYIKLAVDQQKKPGYFVLTGSQNFLVNKAITDSLAGRVGILNLYPLTNHELFANNLVDQSNYHQIIFTGNYPRIYADQLPAAEFYASYILSYVQRDIGDLINPSNLSTFRRFVQLCAGRIGQLCNINALAIDAGISSPTAKSWLSILEANYILFFLEPYFNNFNKRLIKTPKLYFFDTGLACSLLKINSAETLSNSHFQGALFECFIIADLYKQACNLGLSPALYFWRDKGGAHEIDCILEHNGNLCAIEIKSGKHINQDYFRGLNYWHTLANTDPANAYLVYTGLEKQYRKDANVIPWQATNNFLHKLINF